jgi:hypothetical protein
MPLNFFTILTIISIFLATILADKSEYLQKSDYANYSCVICTGFNQLMSKQSCLSL